MKNIFKRASKFTKGVITVMFGVMTFGISLVASAKYFG